MCAAVASTPLPLYQEGQQYWQSLADECRRYVECVNATLVQNQVDAEGLLRCILASETLRITEPRAPSFNVEVTVNYRHWGPVLGVTLYGQQGNGEKFLPQEFELPLAVDGDKQTVAIYDEGRSFSPHDVASYLIQYFHCCYPSISFPC